ncbi:MAG: DUF1566 domain-containing protein [Deltaproteobacteria bacterium]|jgi:hypothetical protein|nr:DUF1566 domain-containing protein [Deltaproteobacteria bacterium]
MKNCSHLIIAIILLCYPSPGLSSEQKVVVIPLGGKKATGTAVAEDVINGKTFSNDKGVGISGTLIIDKANIRKTEVVTCFDNIGDQRDCAGSGEDGEYQKGVSVTPRFVANVIPEQDIGIGGGIAGNSICDGGEICNGTVTDKLTGLTWLADAHCPGTISHNPDNDTVGRMTWQHALDFVQGINSGIYNCADSSNDGSHQTDWRLPNIEEIHSLSDWDARSTWLVGKPFTGVVRSPYWSSTSYKGFEENAATAHISPGLIWYWEKSLPVAYVWPVRGGQ